MNSPLVRLRTTALALPAIAVALLAAGCGGGSAANVLPQAQETPAPAPAAPPTPAGGQTTTAKGAKPTPAAPKGGAPKSGAPKSGATTSGGAAAPPAAPAGPQKVALTADMSQLKWVETMLGPVKAGAIEIDMTNPSAIPHNVAIQDQNGMQIGPTGATIMGGATDTLKVDLQPGTYKVVCLVPGHIQTMNIPLTVE